MRKFEIKHPEYGHFGVLGQYDDRRLTHDPKLPLRMVRSLKSPARAELKEIVLEAVLKVMNDDTKVI